MSIGNLFKKMFSHKDANANLNERRLDSGMHEIEEIEIDDNGQFQSVAADAEDYWGQWDPEDLDEYMRRTDEISEAHEKGPEQLKAVLNRYGCRDLDEYRRIQDTFVRHGLLRRRATFSAGLSDEAPRFEDEYFDAVVIEEATGQALGEDDQPCSFEMYVEIVAALGVWRSEGLDVNEMLSETFGMTSLDWSNMSAWWHERVVKDSTLTSRMGALYSEYEALYRNPVAETDDISDYQEAD